MDHAEGMSGAFDQIWDLIKARPQRPDYFMDVVPEGADLDLGEAMEDFSMPEVDVNEIGGAGDKCCADLRNALTNLSASSLRHYNGLSGEMNEALHGSINFDEGLERASCENLIEAVNDAISYGEYALEQGGNTVAYWKDYGFRTEAHAMAEHRERLDDEDGRHEMDFLNQLRQLRLEYEACKMVGGGFDGARENEATGFYASADPFERTWDLLMKAPLDFDSIKPVAYPEGEEDSNRLMHTADFVHPRTGVRYPINISTPSLSHDFEIRVEYPPAEEGYYPEGDFFGPGDSRLDDPRDPVIGRKVAQANVHYHPDYEPNEGDYDLSFMYPPSNSIVGISPYVAAEMRGAGIGPAIYDLIRALGYRIKPSRNLSDAGEAMWRKNQGRDIEDQSEWRGMRERDE